MFHVVEGGLVLRTLRGPVVAVAAAVMLPVVGCDGQNALEDLEYRVDETPIDREQTAPVISYAGTVRDVRPAVVSVYSRRVVEEEPGLLDHPLFRRFFGEGAPAGEEAPERMMRGIGSGVIISPQGFILTNNHVIAEAERVAVRLDNGREYDAEIVGRDPQTDVAVLRIEADDLPTAILSDSDQAEVGDVVFALGNALGIGHAVTTGIVSARGRTEIGILGEEGFEDFIQTDAAMNIGNSGGPLVDAKGRVIGINTAIASPGGGNIGIGFAIPINLARNVMENLIEYGEVQRGFLGIQMQGLTPELAEEFGVEDVRGALVVNVVPDSPAEEAGLESGDVIVTLDGETVESPGDLRVQIGQMRPETQIELGIVRDGEESALQAQLARKEEMEEVASAEPAETEGHELVDGVIVEPLDSELRAQLGIGESIDGLVIVGVNPRSPYAGAIPPGAVILQINRESVGDLESAREALQEGRNLFLIQHGDALHYVAVDADFPGS